MDYERRETANNVLNFFRSNEGFPGGSFTQKLLSAIAAADSQNRARIAQGFPTLVEFFELCALRPGGFDELRKIAQGE